MKVRWPVQRAALHRIGVTVRELRSICARTCPCDYGHACNVVHGRTKISPAELAAISAARPISGKVLARDLLVDPADLSSRQRVLVD